jgi:prevent-host-death family protein
MGSVTLYRLRAAGNGFYTKLRQQRLTFWIRSDNIRFQSDKNQKYCAKRKTMHKTQQIEPMTTIQRSPHKVMAMLAHGPVVLANRSKPAAVLVSVALWDRLMERLDDQEDIIEALEAKLAIETGKAEMMAQAEIQSWLDSDEPLPA